MNKIFLIGNLTRDPELRYTPSGAAVCSFTLAVSRTFVDKQTGQREADFINIVVWNKSAENCAKYLNKGRQTAVEGRLQIRSYVDNDGVKRWMTEVIADHVEFLNGGQKQESQQSGGSGGFDGMGQEIMFDDSDIPF